MKDFSHFHQPASGRELSLRLRNDECTLFPSPNTVGWIHNSSKQNLSCHIAAATALKKKKKVDIPLSSPENPPSLAACCLTAELLQRYFFTSEARIISFGKHGGDAPVEDREKRCERGPCLDFKPLGQSMRGSECNGNTVEPERACERRKQQKGAVKWGSLETENI